ncbi:CheB methylesterase domain-containing protein [Hyalangium minutum]|uniref:protein-glutamate methylesterase n=1 Tax=Hyalangium minutum TaxID=394096 RepID=A0A085WML6_9BACT|nr:CheB methylesterase domain-containing protein [Hyalangium minutum]KFE68929.1 Chemotaxis response regulator protein-glutamate methylesterase CheB [Hyalangium minutum]
MTSLTLPRPSRPPLLPAPARAPRAVVMGGSTGGPTAVRQLIRGLPRDFSLPIFLVLHLSESFENTLIELLGKDAPFPVRQAVDGEPLPPVGLPQVVMARANRHLRMHSGRLWLTDEPERHSCRPSVDVLFESAAQQLGPYAIGCLLTGMGRDGAQGLQALQKVGATTLAQDEASSAVFGMPCEAIRLGAVQHVVGLQDLPGCLAALARTAVKGRPA